MMGECTLLMVECPIFSRNCPIFVESVSPLLREYTPIGMEVPPLVGDCAPPLPLWGTVPPMALVRECTSEVIPVQNTKSRDSGIPTKKSRDSRKSGKISRFPENREFSGISRKSGFPKITI